MLDKVDEIILTDCLQTFDFNNVIVNAEIDIKIEVFSLLVHVNKLKLL